MTRSLIDSYLNNFIGALNSQKEDFLKRGGGFFSFFLKSEDWSQILSSVIVDSQANVQSTVVHLHDIC